MCENEDGRIPDVVDAHAVVVVVDGHGPAARAGVDVGTGGAAGDHDGRGGGGLPLSCMERTRVCEAAGSCRVMTGRCLEV